jgi:hypothetical protein
MRWTTWRRRALRARNVFSDNQLPDWRRVIPTTSSIVRPQFMSISQGGFASDISRSDVATLIERERHVLAEIAAGVPLDRVLEKLILAVKSQAKSRMMASVLFVSEDGRHLLHGAGPSLPAEYNAVVDGIATGEGVVPAAPRSRAMRLCTPTTSRRIRTGRISGFWRWVTVFAPAGPLRSEPPLAAYWALLRHTTISRARRPGRTSRPSPS